MKIKIKLFEGGKIPEKQTSLSAGYDLFANESVVLKSQERKLIKLGFALALPENAEAQIRPRSGLALKYGITVLNAPGTIDADYRNEVGVLLINLGEADFAVLKHDRIAQMVLSEIIDVDFQKCDDFQNTSRTGGWGSTGI